MSDIRRRADGTLVGGGASLNPAGRRGKRRLVTPSDFRKAIIGISRRKVPVPLGRGGTERITLFAFHVRNLSSGNPKTRLGSKDFIRLVQRAANISEQLPDRLPADRSLRVPSCGSEGRNAATGRFVAGVSGNPRGRPRGRPAPLPLQQYLQIIGEANRRVEIIWQEKAEKVTAFEAQLLRLGAASGGARIAARKYVELVLDAAAQAMWRQKKEDERYWRTMANGTDEERQALLAEHPGLPPVENMPDDILEQTLENVRRNSRTWTG